MAGLEGDVAGTELDVAAAEDGADVVAAAGVVAFVGVVVGVVVGVGDGEGAGVGEEGVAGVAAGVVGHGPYIPPHNCAKVELERVTSKNVRKANLDKESLNIASLLSAIG